jgi:hypothetical protein
VKALLFCKVQYRAGCGSEFWAPATACLLPLDLARLFFLPGPTGI